MAKKSRRHTHISKDSLIAAMGTIILIGVGWTGNNLTNDIKNLKDERAIAKEEVAAQRLENQKTMAELKQIAGTLENLPCNWVFTIHNKDRIDEFHGKDKHPARCNGKLGDSRKVIR